MPTGTGKTETMLALLVATRPTRLLVVVPATALRDQIANKFETLGILQQERIVAATAMRPLRGQARARHQGCRQHRPSHCRNECRGCYAPRHIRVHADARERLLASFSHLMVDEVHHAPAPSWVSIIAAFADRNVLLFTATPFREDSRPIPGRTIYRFPLREAQKDGYFTTIDYQNVVSLEDTDSVLADLAIARLRADLGRRPRPHPDGPCS
jgi:superfamily II DNA or RNA helicase